VPFYEINASVTNPTLGPRFAELKTLELSTHSRWILEEHLTELIRLKEKLAETEKPETTADDAIVTKLQTYKGVGLITVVTLRAEIGRFDRFRSGKQLARFCVFRLATLRAESASPMLDWSRQSIRNYGQRSSNRCLASAVTTSGGVPCGVDCF